MNGQPRISLFVPDAAIDAGSANWAANARLLDVNGQARISLFVPNAAIDAASANWAAKAKLLDINGRPVHQTPLPSGGLEQLRLGRLRYRGRSDARRPAPARDGAAWPAPLTA